MTRPLRVGAMLARSRANGPGERAVVWLQGCDRRPSCPGCGNAALLDPAGPAEEIAPADLAARLLAAPGGAIPLAGITISGGEPFLQAGPAAELARLVSSADPRLSVVVYTGHTLEELRAARRPDWDALLAATDLLVDGPFRRDLSPAGPLCASANQRLLLLRGRIRPGDLPAEEAHVEVEAHVGPEGELTFTGGCYPLAPEGP